ncbi:MAG: acyltransferase family protein [Candidatus Heimdallarchaeaceae archaeon]
MKRIKEVDFLRGIAILFMMFFHGSYYWNSLPSKTQMNQMLANPLAGLAILLGKSAGFFALISGLANSISMYSRLSLGKSKPLKVFYSGLVTGLWVIFVGKIQVSIFNHTLIGDPLNPYPEGTKQYSLIIGSLETGRLQLPSIYTVVYKNTALFAIGMSIIFTALILSLLSVHEGYKKVKRNLFIIGVLALTIIFTTDWMKSILRPLWINAYISNQHLKGALLSIVIGDSYPFFPFMGYALVGAMFGIAFQQELPRKIVSGTGLFFGLALTVAGFICLGIFGNPDITETFQTLPIQWNLPQIGIQILICSLTYWIHFSPKEHFLKRIFQSTFVRRFGLVTLSIFVFEPLVGTVIELYVLNILFPGWNNKPLLPFLYAIGLISLWYIFLKLWERIKFKGSLEWLNGEIIRILSRREATRSTIFKNLYGEKSSTEEDSETILQAPAK